MLIIGYVIAIAVLSGLVLKIHFFPKYETIKPIAKQIIETWRKPIRSRRAWIVFPLPEPEIPYRTRLAILKHLLTHWIMYVVVCILMFSLAYCFLHIPILKALHNSAMMQSFTSSPNYTESNVHIVLISLMQMVSSFLLFIILIMLIQHHASEGLKHTDIRGEFASECCRTKDRLSSRAAIFYLASEASRADSDAQEGEDLLEFLSSKRVEIIEEVINIFLLKPEILRGMNRGKLEFALAEVGAQAKSVLNEEPDNLEYFLDKIRLVESYMNMLLL